MLKNLIVFDKRFETNSKITHALGLKNLSFICSFKNLSELDDEIFSVFVSSYNNDKLLTTKKFDVIISPNSELLNSEFNIELDEAYTDVKAFIFKDFIPICDEFSLNVGNSEENPYLIKNEYDFCYSLHENRYKYYKLDSDIILNDGNYEAFNLFSNIDGDNHTITINLCNKPFLFNAIGSNTFIKNLVLDGEIIAPMNTQSIGSLSRLINKGSNITLYNIHSKCKIFCEYDDNHSRKITIGGIVGSVSSGTNINIENICFTGTIDIKLPYNKISGQDYRIGGIFGACSVDLSKILFKGNIIVTAPEEAIICYLGGIVGIFEGINIFKAASFTHFSDKAYNTTLRSGSLASIITKNNFELKDSYFISEHNIPGIFRDANGITTNTKLCLSYSNRKIDSQNFYYTPIKENLYEDVDFTLYNQEDYIGFDFENIWEWDDTKPILRGTGYFYELQK